MNRPQPETITGLVRSVRLGNETDAVQTAIGFVNRCTANGFKLGMIVGVLVGVTAGIIGLLAMVRI